MSAACSSVYSAHATRSMATGRPLWVLLTRVAGMLLAAIAVQMLADGVLAFLRQV